MTTEELRPGLSKDNLLFDRLIFSLLCVFLLASAFSIAVTQIGYFSALTIWLGRMLLRRKGDFPQTRLDLFFLAYAVAEVLATVFSVDRMYSLLYLQRRLLLLPIVSILLASATTEKRLKMLFTLLVVSAVGVALWSMRDVVFHFDDYLHFRRRLGEFQIYMTAGGIMMIAILLLLPFVVHRGTPRGIRLAAAAAMVPLGVNLLFTFTRSSWLGFLGGAFVIGVIRSKKIFLPMSLLLLAVLMFASPEMKGRMYSIVDPRHPTNVSRIHMWSVGGRIFADHPIVGIGDVGLETVWYSYSDPLWEAEGHLHNNYVMWLVTLGTVGYGALVALFAMIGITVKRIEKKLRDDWFAGSLCLGGLAAFVAFHINGFFEWNFGDAEIIMLMWAILGLILAAENIHRPSKA